MPTISESNYYYNRFEGLSETAWSAQERFDPEEGPEEREHRRWQLHTKEPDTPQADQVRLPRGF